MRIKKRKERIWRVTWMDALLILLALAAIGAVAFHLAIRQKNVREVSVLCTVRIPALERSLLEMHEGDLIPLGSRVRTENGTTDLGSVRAVRVLPHYAAAVLEEGLSWVENEALADVELTVEMQGVRRGGEGIRVQDIRVAAGGKGSFRIGGYLASGAEILSVEVWEA